MHTKSIIQILVCILLGYMAKATDTATGQADSTSCAAAEAYSSGWRQTPEKVFLSENGPKRQQLKFKNKFRAATNFAGSLTPPVTDAAVTAYCTFTVLSRYRPYWLSPFYYIFLFRYTPF